MWLVVTVVKLIMARSSLAQASQTKRAEETMVIILMTRCRKFWPRSPQSKRVISQVASCRAMFRQVAAPSQFISGCMLHLTVDQEPGWLARVESLLAQLRPG